MSADPAHGDIHRVHISVRVTLGDADVSCFDLRVVVKSERKIGLAEATIKPGFQ